MKEIIILYLFFIFFPFNFFSYTCREISINQFESNQINIKKNKTNCVIFSFENKVEGNIILKLVKSNSFTSNIYLYDNKDTIEFNSEENEFINYKYKYHIGEDFYKEKKIENMNK